MAFSAAQFCSSQPLAIYTNPDKATLVVDVLAVATLVALVCLTVIGKWDVGLGEVGTLQNKAVLALLGVGGAIAVGDLIALLIKTCAPAPLPEESSEKPFETHTASSSTEVLPAGQAAAAVEDFQRAPAPPAAMASARVFSGVDPVIASDSLGIGARTGPLEAPAAASASVLPGGQSTPASQEVVPQLVERSPAQYTATGPIYSLNAKGLALFEKASKITYIAGQTKQKYLAYYITNLDRTIWTVFVVPKGEDLQLQESQDLVQDPERLGISQNNSLHQCRINLIVVRRSITYENNHHGKLTQVQFQFPQEAVVETWSSQGLVKEEVREIFENSKAVILKAVVG